MSKKNSEKPKSDEIVVTAPAKVFDRDPKTLKYDEKYMIYRMWRALPITMLRKMNRDEIYAKVGIDDPYILDLTDIHTQTQFAEIYDLSIDTLTDWNNRIRIENPLDEARAWAQTMTKNLIFTLYSKAVRSGDPFQIELFFKVVNKWEEKMKVDVDYKGVTEFKIERFKPSEVAPKIDQQVVPSEVDAKIIEVKPNGTTEGYAIANTMADDRQAA